MSHVPPPYATDPEQKGFYPSLPPDQQQQPVGYYPPQPQPGPTAPPGQTTVTYYPPAGPPQQHTQQLIITKPTPVIVGDAEAEPVRSYVAHIVVSVFVCFCCYCLLGLIAFICAGKQTSVELVYTQQ